MEMCFTKPKNKSTNQQYDVIEFCGPLTMMHMKRIQSER